MKKSYLQSQVRRTEWAYLFFVMWAHYLYLGKPGLQLLYWLTAGGFGIWFLIDLFTMESKIKNHNMPIFMEIEELERQKSTSVI